MKKKLVLLFLLTASIGNGYAQPFEKQINSLIKKAISLNRFNRTILVSQKGKIIYEKAFGYQDFAKQVPNSTNTIYQIGSTTKEFTAAITLFGPGYFLQIEVFMAVGILLFAHSSFDRVISYGLKYQTGFNDTHLGKLKKDL